MRYQLYFLLFTLCVVSLGGKAVLASVDKLYQVHANQITSYIAGKNEKRVVFVYTSWCPHCRRAMPEIMRAAKTYKPNIIAISMDQDDKQLLEYLNGLGDITFNVLIWNREGDIQSSFKEIGIDLPNGIPFIALLDAEGKVVKQGVLDPSEVTRFLNE